MTTEPNSLKDLNSFISDLQNNPDFFNKIAPSLALLIPGNWEGLINLAASSGYNFSANDVLKFMNEHPKKEKLFNNNHIWANWAKSQLK
jgi:hypothetical protein